MPFFLSINPSVSSFVRRGKKGGAETLRQAKVYEETTQYTSILEGATRLHDASARKALPHSKSGPLTPPVLDPHSHARVVDVQSPQNVQDDGNFPFIYITASSIVAFAYNSIPLSVCLPTETSLDLSSGLSSLGRYSLLRPNVEATTDTDLALQRAISEDQCSSAECPCVPPTIHTEHPGFPPHFARALSIVCRVPHRE
jgi:hypothetical protein